MAQYSDIDIDSNALLEGLSLHLRNLERTVRRGPLVELDGIEPY